MHRWLSITSVALLIVLLLKTDSIEAQNASPKCGSLNEKLLNNYKRQASPNEFPWIARLLFTRKDNNTINTKCLATLISNRHLLVPAHCVFANLNDTASFSLQLGIWKETNDTTEWSCSRVGYCVPPPVIYKLESIKIHHYYDEYTHDNNIAILTLDRDVKPSSYIEPICRDAPDELDSIVSKFLPIAGFISESQIKNKASVFGISRRYCDNIYKNPLNSFTSTQFCAHQNTEDLFYSGSTLMGINIERDVPKYFYLVGYVVSSSVTMQPYNPVLSIFQSVKPYKKWIDENIIMEL